MSRWRRNADEGLRVAERAAAGGDVYALADLYRRRMRAGTLDPEGLLLAARIPFKNGDLHQAAERAFGAPIPQARSPRELGGDDAFGRAFMSLFYLDLQDEVDGGELIPAERVIYRVGVLIKAMDYQLQMRGLYVGRELYDRARYMIENMSRWPRGSYVRLDGYRQLCRDLSDDVDRATRRTTDTRLAWNFFMNDLKRWLLA